MEPKTGDTVRVKLTGGGIQEGVFLPSADASLVAIKLSNGYNMVFDNKNVKALEVLKKSIEKKGASSPTIKPSGKPVVAILHTGGTIASKVDYKTGAVHPLFSSEELFSLFPELGEMITIESRHISDVFSEDLAFSHYNKIGSEIKKLEDKVKGIIVTSGTDTLHYTASALSFMLEGLSMPVLLAASQRSSDRGSSDAALNVINAAFFIIKTDYAGVGICMHASSDDTDCFILGPHNARKMHTSRRDAFRPINALPIARVDYLKHKVEFISKDYPRAVKGVKLKLMPFKEDIKVGWLMHRPNLPIEEIKGFEKFHGVLISGTGFGHISDDALKALKPICQNIPVVMASQCIYGRVNLDVYSRGKVEQDYGIIPSCQGITAETAYIKLAWLLSNFPKQKIRELFCKDFRGEAIPRITERAFLY